MTGIAAQETIERRPRRPVAVATEGLFLAGVLLLPVMQFGTVQVIGTSVIPADVCFAFAVLGAAILEVARRGRDLRAPFPIVVAAYLVVLVLAALASPDQQESFERILIDGYCCSLGIAAYVIAREAIVRVRIAWAWVVASGATVLAALVGIMFFFLGARTPSENFTIGDLGSIHTETVPRVVGFFENSNLLCNYLVVGLLFMLGVVGWRRPAGLALVIATSVVLAFTLSPGLAGAVVAVTLWLFVSEPRWAVRTRAALAVLGAIGAVAFIVVTVEVGPRVHTWSDAVDTIARSPLLGVGPGLPVAATTYEGRYFTDAHNALLNVGGQAGLLGLLALAGIMASICVLAWRARPVSDVPEPVRAGWCAFVGAVLFGGLSLSLEQTRHVWVLLGFVAAGLAARRHEPERATSVS
jgi:O-antigen ligase